MELSGSTTVAVGRGVSGVAAPGAEVAELSSDEQAATNKSRSKTAGQKMPWRQDGKIKFKKRSPGNLHSSAVVMEYYEWLE
jgi:hypothetical protein